MYNINDKSTPFKYLYKGEGEEENQLARDEKKSRGVAKETTDLNGHRASL